MWCCSEVDEAAVAGNTILLVLLYSGNVRVISHMCAYMVSCICRLVREPCCADVRVSCFSVNCDRRDSKSPSTAQEWTNRTPISHEPMICTKMCFTKTESVL